MKKIILVVAFVSFSVMLLSGCQSSYNHKHEQSASTKSELITANHNAGDNLIKNVEGKLNARTILATSFVNIDDLTVSSSFGRISSQQIATRFLNSGYNVEEMLLRKNIYIKQQSGEFLLSRDLQIISDSHYAQGVIVGTYAVGRKFVYVTAKVVDAISSEVIAAHDYQVYIDSDVMNLLGGQSKYRK